MVDKLASIEEFMTRKIWFADNLGVRRLTGFSVKVEPNGFLAILKGISAEGPVVAFMSVPSLEKLFRSLTTTEGLEALKWRPDKFALDKLSEKR